MLPLRFVTEELGCTVEWEDKTKTVTITYKQESQQIIDKISSEGEKYFQHLEANLFFQMEQSSLFLQIHFQKIQK